MQEKELEISTNDDQEKKENLWRTYFVNLLIFQAFYPFMLLVDYLIFDDIYPWWKWFAVSFLAASLEPIGKYVDRRFYAKKSEKQDAV